MAWNGDRSQVKRTHSTQDLRNTYEYIGAKAIKDHYSCGRVLNFKMLLCINKSWGSLSIMDAVNLLSLYLQHLEF